MASKDNTIKFHKRIRINLGLVIFIIIFIYVCVCLYISNNQVKIEGFQVKKGVLSENRIYSGIAIRDEHVLYSNHSGYINYFVREGEKAGYNNLIYCIDETGKFSDIFSKDPTDNLTLNDAELASMKQEFKLFAKSFDETNFSDAVSFEKKINNQLSMIENRKVLLDIDRLKAMHVNDIIDYVRLYDSGVILFYKDGYEEMIASDLSLDDFDESKYYAKTVLNDDLVEVGSFVCKYIYDENWSIVIKVPNSEVMKITADEYVDVLFTKNQTHSWGKVKLINTYDDYSMIELSFTNSMVNFCTDRFVEIELILEEDTGLKIPNSAITAKNFFTIDKEFVSVGLNLGAYSVSRSEMGEGGESSIKEVEITVVKEDDDFYYVDPSSLSYGDKLIRKDAVSTESKNALIVGSMQPLEGVYCINKGYTEFKRVEALYANAEYTIIKSNSAYGLREYDFVALDARSVEENQFVN